MGCGCNKNVSGPVQAIGNLVQAANSQPDTIKWFKEGIKGIVKAIGVKSEYSDPDIQLHRDICRKCDHSTKSKDGQLTGFSQCMYPDPEKGGAPCGCFILAKTQAGKCPAKLWPITINGV